MELDRTKLWKILVKQTILEENNRGFQPSATLGCFYDLRVDGVSISNTSICENCPCYKTCITYLKYFEVSPKKNVEPERAD